MTIHQLIEFRTVELDPSVLSLIRSLLRGSRSDATATTPMLKQICQLNTLWSRVAAREVLRMMTEVAAREGIAIDKNDVVVASHGQTVWHEDPGPDSMASGDRIELRCTLQIGDGEILCGALGCVVVSNFRALDVALGGRGAPLVPYFDRLFAGIVTRQLNDQLNAAARGRVSPEDIVFQNIGGIGNCCMLEHDGVVAFDTGPGNAVLNEFLTQGVAWLSEHHAEVSIALKAAAASADARHDPLPLYDVNGTYSEKGVVREEWLAAWWAEHEQYFAAPPPKSTGRERFGSSFVARMVMPLLEQRPDAETFYAICRTIVELTALSVARAYAAFLPRIPSFVAVSGGGALNRVMMSSISSALNSGNLVWSCANALRIHGRIEVIKLSAIFSCAAEGPPGGNERAHCHWGIRCRGAWPGVFPDVDTLVLPPPPPLR
jgi:1,6-anhydro-N-acetylmuramate kinase